MPKVTTLPQGQPIAKPGSLAFEGQPNFRTLMGLAEEPVFLASQCIFSLGLALPCSLFSHRKHSSITLMHAKLHFSVCFQGTQLKTGLLFPTRSFPFAL